MTILCHCQDLIIILSSLQDGSSYDYLLTDTIKIIEAKLPCIKVESREQCNLSSKSLKLHQYDTQEQNIILHWKWFNTIMWCGFISACSFGKKETDEKGRRREVGF